MENKYFTKTLIIRTIKMKVQINSILTNGELIQGGEVKQTPKTYLRNTWMFPKHEYFVSKDVLHRKAQILQPSILYFVLLVSFRCCVSILRRSHFLIQFDHFRFWFDLNTIFFLALFPIDSIRRIERNFFELLAQL